MLCSVFALVSCGNDKDKETTTAATQDSSTTATPKDSDAATSADAAATTAQSTSDSSSSNSGAVSDVDFAGHTFTFVVQYDTASNGWSCADIYTETTTGNIINDAIWTRNQEVENNYNCKVRDYRAPSAVGFMIDQVKMGSSEYDFVVGPNSLTTYARGNNFYNLKNVVDTTAEWWDQALIRDTAIAGKIFGLTGAFSTIDNDAMWVMFFNKDMIEQNQDQFTSPYDLVYNNQWTWDKFITMCELAKDDVNTNTTMEWDVDTYGLATHNDTSLALYAAAGHRFCTVDAEGNASITFGTTSNEGDVMQAIINIMTADYTMNANIVGCGVPNALRSVFTRGGSLFYAEVLGSIVYLADVEDFRFGIVPFPKYTSTDEYYQRLNGNTMFVAVPTTIYNMQLAGKFLDLFSYHSMLTVEDAYINRSIKTLYVSDADVAEMIDIIIASRTYDLGYTCNLGSLYKLYVSNIDEGKQVAAQIARAYGGDAEAELESIVNDFTNHQ